MWLSGFYVPSLATLYLDKPLKAHTLMQAIARANRVNEGKNNGLIVDYCGILKSLRQALATFGGSSGAEDDGEVDPVRPEEELLQDLSAAIGLVKDYLVDKSGDLNAVVSSSGFETHCDD
jgi:type I restriction enzyme R subunit